MLASMSGWSMRGTSCGAELGDLQDAVATICIDAMGDEEDRTWFLCETCDAYSVWVCNEAFFTDEVKMWAEGPITREKGDQIVGMIRQCPAPRLKSCRCPAHRKLSR
jgi:hypothetical protein